MDIFSYCHFHNASKNAFGSKKFQISCTDSKVPFMQEKVQKGDFLKKHSRELNFFLFYVPMNPLKASNAKLEAGIFLVV